MTTNSRIKVSEVDYNQIRENLKTFLSGQSEFSDYNFDGSALSVLIDVLAYNTHYNALYTNLAINEMFLDSASKRSSVVSLANNFGYLPASAQASVAEVDVSLIDAASQDDFKILPKYTPFSSSISGESYTFYTVEDYTSAKIGSEYKFNSVKLYEGIPAEFSFICTELEEKFILPNREIDLSTIVVTVQQTGEQPDYERYALASSVLSLDADSKVFFIKELEDESYQLYFGTNNLGKPILPGNVVTVQYLVTNKSLANGCTVFSYSGGSQTGAVTTITVAASSGGKEKETIEEIKYNVTRNYQNQDRAVTTEDYSSIIKRYYEDVRSISVWGGEDNDPPIYGKVFVAIRPNSKPYLDEYDKAFIKQNILRSKSVVGIVPEIVDPSYLELSLNCTLYYNEVNTSRSQAQLIAAATNAIVQYNEQNLNSFNGVFRYSRLSSIVDSVDQSILSNIINFKIYSEVFPKYNSVSEYKFNLGNPIYNELVPEESFRSTGFFLDSTSTVYYLDDDGISNIRLFYFSPIGEKIIVDPSIGTIDYSLGVVHVKGLKIVNLDEPNLYFIFKTQSYDVIPSRNYIINIPNSKISVSAVKDVASRGITPSVKNYTFTSSRS